MKASLRTVQKGAYVIRSSELKKLWTLIEGRIGSPKLEADCADDTQRTFPTWQDCEAYENVSSKQIIELSLVARSDDFESSVSIDWSPRFDYTVRIVVDCPASDMTSLREDIGDILDGMRHRVLSYMAGRDFLIGLAFAALVSGVVGIVAYVLLFGRVPPGDIEAETLSGYVVLNLYVCLALLVFVLRDRQTTSPASSIGVLCHGARRVALPELAVWLAICLWVDRDHCGRP